MLWQQLPPRSIEPDAEHFAEPGPQFCFHGPLEPSLDGVTLTQTMFVLPDPDVPLYKENIFARRSDCTFICFE